MSTDPIRAIPSPVQSEITISCELALKAAHGRYFALRLAARLDPSLLDEECFQILLNDSCATFSTIIFGGDE